MCSAASTLQSQGSQGFVSANATGSSLYDIGENGCQTRFLSAPSLTPAPLGWDNVRGSASLDGPFCSLRHTQGNGEGREEEEEVEEEEEEEEEEEQEEEQEEVEEEEDTVQWSS
ncbi:unnamed protein product [Lota lota]